MATKSKLLELLKYINYRVYVTTTNPEINDINGIIKSVDLRKMKLILKNCVGVSFIKSSAGKQMRSKLLRGKIILESHIIVSVKVVYPPSTEKHLPTVSFAYKGERPGSNNVAAREMPPLIPLVTPGIQESARDFENLSPSHILRRPPILFHLPEIIINFPRVPEVDIKGSGDGGSGINENK